MKPKKTILAALALLFFFSCERSEMQVPIMEKVDDSPVFMDWSHLNQNARIAPQDYALYMAEYITTPESGQVGRTVFFMDVGNKQLNAHFVPGMQLDGTDRVSYYIDESRPSVDLPVEVSTAAINRAMQTWDDVICSDLGMLQVPYDPTISTGFISDLLGFGGSGEYVADIVHGGWLPGDFFDLLAPGGSDFILGVTFTLIFTDQGVPTDVDNNRKFDVAWREIYYNDNFPWADGAHYDVETIALHEAGHGLSQGHFGTAFLSKGNNKLHFSPLAVMNAGYSQIQTDIGKTDNGGHCSIWGSWPVK